MRQYKIRKVGTYNDMHLSIIELLETSETKFGRGSWLYANLNCYAVIFEKNKKQQLFDLNGTELNIPELLDSEPVLKELLTQ